VAAKEAGDHHRGSEGVDLDDILSIQTEHVLRNDRTVVHQKRWYQVLNKTRAQKVTIHEYLNGRTVIKYGKNRLQYKPIEQKLEKAVIRKVKSRKRYHVPKDHIWRSGFKLKGSLKN
jgi:hypothetical protein